MDYLRFSLSSFFLSTLSTMEINLRLILPCRLHESAPRNLCALVATLFSVENKRFSSLDLRHETNSSTGLPRSIDHSRPRQPFNDPCRISANHNAERFQVQCSSSRVKCLVPVFGIKSKRILRVILMVPVESVFGRIMGELIDLEVFSCEKIIIFEYTFERWYWKECKLDYDRILYDLRSIFERF